MTDYIKREDALKRRHGCDGDCKTCNFFTDGDSWCEGDVFVLDLLSIPAADVVEQKHGNWILKSYEGSSGVYQCSVCKARGRKQIFLFNFCPDCGAKMDGE